MLALLVAVVAGGVALLGATTAAAQETVTISAGDFYFCAPSYEGGVCETTITAGDTVVWDFNAGQSQHTTTECGASCDAPASSPLWNSGFLDSGTYPYTFTQPGTYLYFCRVHPALQRGRIVVQAAPEGPTATSPPVPENVPLATNTPPPGVPKTGQGSGNTLGAAWWLVGALGAAGAFLAGVGAFAYARGRRIE